MKTQVELINRIVKFKVEKNEKYGDFRVVKYINGIWNNEIDGNWNKNKAVLKCKSCNEILKRGHEAF